MIFIILKFTFTHQNNALQQQASKSPTVILIVHTLNLAQAPKPRVGGEEALHPMDHAGLTNNQTRHCPGANLDPWAKAWGGERVPQTGSICFHLDRAHTAGVGRG